MGIIELGGAGSRGVRFGAGEGEYRARALEAWREAEAVVRGRWEAFVAADLPSRRRAAFAAYVAALDGEAAAAQALAAVSVDVAVAA